MMINGKELSEPEVRAYVKELETTVRQLRDRTEELENKLDNLGEELNMTIAVNGFLEEQNKRCSIEMEQAEAQMKEAIKAWNELKERLRKAESK